MEEVMRKEKKLVLRMHSGLYKISKKKFIFFEVPIKYNGRGYDEGKKIGIKDAFQSFILHYKNILFLIRN